MATAALSEGRWMALPERGVLRGWPWSLERPGIDGAIARGSGEGGANVLRALVIMMLLLVYRPPIALLRAGA